MKRGYNSTIIVLFALLGVNSIATAATNYFTEYFNGDFDLGGLSMTFDPLGGSNYYEVVDVKSITELPISTYLYSAIPMNRTDYQSVTISGNSVHLYGTWYNHFWVFSNGYIEFREFDWWGGSPSTYAHFKVPHISPYYADLDPSAGGAVKIFQLQVFGTPRAMVVSFEDVPRYNNPGVLCSFQCIMYYGGAIEMAWLHTSDPGSVLVGLSRGDGVPSDYQETNLSSYYAAPPSPNDMDGDGLPDAWEAFYFGSYANCAPYGHGDSDDYDNESEYIAGTDPTDGSSYFSVGCTMGSSQIVLNWNALTGRVYSVTHTESLTSPFTNMATGITYPQNSYTAPLGSGEEKGFFKTGVQMAP